MDPTLDPSTYGRLPTAKTKEYIIGLFVHMWNAVLLGFWAQRHHQDTSPYRGPRNSKKSHQARTQLAS